MPKRHENEVVLASWSVDAPTWRAFVRAVGAYATQPGPRAPSFFKFDEQPPSPAGAEVVIRDDALFVGTHAADIPWPPTVTLRPDWLEFYFAPSDGGWFIVPAPVSLAARTEAARVAEHFGRREAEALRRNAEAQRAAAEERARPTLRNRLLNVVEGHFILILLAFFFILLPAVVGLIALASAWPGAPEP